MGDAQEALSDFEKFSSDEKKRAEAFAKSQRNEKASEWWADKKLSVARKSMQDFFTKDEKFVGGNKNVALFRAVDTVAAYDRAYKFRIQSRLDNVPRQDAQMDLEQMYWDQIPKQLKDTAQD